MRHCREGFRNLCRFNAALKCVGDQAEHAGDGTGSALFIAAISAGAEIDSLSIEVPTAGLRRALFVQIDACYAEAEARAKNALEALSGGADFDALIVELGDDEGMRDENLRASGYYVSADSLLWPGEIVSAAMALEAPMDISGAIRTGDGVVILQYLGEVEAGAVPLADVRDAIEADALEEARYAAYEAQVNAWLEEADVKYYPERMQ